MPWMTQSAAARSECSKTSAAQGFQDHGGTFVLGTQDRRALLGMIAASAPLLASSPAFAAYGDSANVFGKVTNKSGFVPYAGENYAVLLPSKWNPSKEREFPNVVLR